MEVVTITAIKVAEAMADVVIQKTNASLLQEDRTVGPMVHAHTTEMHAIPKQPDTRTKLLSRV